MSIKNPIFAISYAFHEVMELFLAKLKILALSRSATEQEIVEEIHSIIRTLENVVFKKQKKTRSNRDGKAKKVDARGIKKNESKRN